MASIDVGIHPDRGPGYPYGEFDAHEWAIEFDRIYPDRRPDTDTMLGWFANAIMTGYDRAKREEEARLAAIQTASDQVPTVMADWPAGPPGELVEVFGK